MARKFSRTASKGRMALNFCSKGVASTAQRKVSRKKTIRSFLKLETEVGLAKVPVQFELYNVPLEIASFTECISLDGPVN